MSVARARIVRPFAAAAAELALSLAMSRRDLTAAFVPALLFAIAARFAAEGPLVDDLVGLGGCAIYFWLFIYAFCLDNQIEGIDEDRLNKPDRVIPSGRLTLAAGTAALVVPVERAQEVETRAAGLGGAVTERVDVGRRRSLLRLSPTTGEPVARRSLSETDPAVLAWYDRFGAGRPPGSR